MQCKICGSDSIKVIFDDYIRDGAPETFTKKKYKMYQCANCRTIWHDIEKNEDFYQSKEYRDKLEGASDINDYYRLHDFEVLDKLIYCGTTIFRNANIADIGCGGGSFLDYLSGVASSIIAIEPSGEYRKNLEKRKYYTYAYATEAIEDWEEKVDVVTSFDVIEHVENPIAFMSDVYHLLRSGGKGVIGTPTDCPLMRKLLGHDYEQKLLYSYQHNWILNELSLRKCCEMAGFKKVDIRPMQRYGISNLINWSIYKRPSGHFKYDFVTDTLDCVYKRELEKIGMSDYIIAYVEK